MIEALFIILIVAALLIALLQWLAPTVGIPGNIINLLKILIVVLAIFKIIALFGYGF